MAASQGARTQTPPPAELADRIRDYGEAWRAAILSTEPADRSRAERAIRSLYAVTDRAEPDIVWVASPAAGMVAAGAAEAASPYLQGRFIRGDVGTGWNQERNAARDPFDLNPGWAARLAARTYDRLVVAGIVSGTSSLTPEPAVQRAFGLDLVGAVAPAVRDAARAARPAPATVGTVLADGATLDSLGEGVLTTTWASLIGIAGRGIARGVLAEAIQRSAEVITQSATQSQGAVANMQPGQFDAVTPAIAAIRDVFGEPLWRQISERTRQSVLIDARLDLARSTGPWWALERRAIVSERPLVAHRDDRGRLHHPHAPAIAWSDGFAMWAWHGVVVGRRAIEDPDSITIADIDGEANIERRRVLVERFGEDRLIREGNAELVHEDETGRLWRRPLRGSGWMGRGSDEPVVMVEVRNSTPEPDGSRRTYLLRVPPGTQTAREAVAWTFGLSFDAYRPAVET